MKKLLLAIFPHIIFMCGAYAQITFQKTLGEAGSDNVRSVYQTNDGGYILTGYAIIGPNSRVYLFKVDENGTLQWAKSYDGGSGSEVGNQVIQTLDGGYIIVGYTTSLGAGNREIFVLKTDPIGNLTWANTFGGSNVDEGWSVKQNTDSTYIIAGFTQSFPGPEAKFYLLKLDAAGNLLWDKTYGGGGYDRCYSVDITTDGGYILFGDATGFGVGSYDYYLVKTDGNGDTLWSKTYGGANGEFAQSVQQTIDGGYILSGFADNYGPGGRDMAVVKTLSNGDLDWAKVYGGSGQDPAYSIKQSNDGGYIIAGYTTSFSFGGGDSETYLVKTDASGNLEWSKIYGDNGTENNDVQLTSDGGYFVTGTASADFHMIKTDSSGNSGCNDSIPATIEAVWAVSVTNPATVPANPAVVENTVTGSVVEESREFALSATTLCIDSGGCNLSVTTTKNDVNCFGNCIGSATANPSGGTIPYTYLWSPSGQATPTADSLCAGTHIVVVTDSAGCTATDTVIFINPLPLVFFISSSPATCNGSCDGEAAITPSGGTPPYYYFWNDPDTQTTAIATGLCSGNYAGVVLDTNGCFAGDTIIVPEPDVLSLTPGSSDASCSNNNGKAWVDVTGGTLPYTYLWDDSLSQTTDTAFNLYAGSYMVIVTDINGCTDSVSVIVNNPGASVITIDSVTNISCNGGNDGEIYITVSGGTLPYTYLWSNSDTIEDIDSLTAGTYIVTVTDNNGCNGVSSISLNQPDALTLTITSITPSICTFFQNGGACVAVIGGVAPFTIVWNDPFTTVDSCITNVYASWYNPVVTDSNGCVDSILVIITNIAGPTIDSIVTTNVTCTGDSNGTATAFVSGGTAPFTYVWQDGGGDTIGTSNPIFGLSGGTYTFTCIDSNGCIATGALSILEPNPIASAIISSTDVSCFGVCDGSAEIVVGGGVLPYTYLWISGDTTSTPDSLCAGANDVMITDANGCQTANSALINGPDSLFITPVVTDVSCNGDSTGAIALIVIGGIPSYTYSWVPNIGSSATVTNLTAGTYSVTVTDASGCIATAAATITQPQILALIASSITPSTCGSDNGNACVNVIGGVAPYVITWNDPDTTVGACIFNEYAGSYNVTVTDANGCTYTMPVNIPDIPGPVIDSITTTEVQCNGDSTGTATVAASGGTAPINYLWNDPLGQTTATAIGLAGSIYTVIVTDVNGCSVSQSALVDENPPLTLIATPDVTICFGDSTEISVTGNGGFGTYFYVWNNGLDSIQTHWVSPVTTTTYTTFIIDELGCRSQDESITVTVFPPLSSSVTATDDGGGQPENITATYTK